jgi:hypothetical protein
MTQGAAKGGVQQDRYKDNAEANTPLYHGSGHGPHLESP